MVLMSPNDVPLCIMSPDDVPLCFMTPNDVSFCLMSPNDVPLCQVTPNEVSFCLMSPNVCLNCYSFFLFGLLISCKVAVIARQFVSPFILMHGILLWFNYTIINE